MRLRRLVAVLAAGAAGLLGTIMVAPAPALAGGSYDLTNTNGDIVGAWGYGSWWWGGDGRLYVSVYVKDTVANNKNASVRLAALYKDNGQRTEALVNNEGAGKTVYTTYSFASNISRVSLRECVDNALLEINCAPDGYHRVFTA